MIILEYSKELQEIRIIPRGDVYSLTFVNQNTKVETEFPLIFADAGYYYTADIDTQNGGLEDETTYRLIAWDKDKERILYKDTVLITNQDVIDNEGVYDMHIDEYISKETSSDYTIYND